MISFDKKTATKALRKLGLEERKSKHFQFKLVVDGRTILTTAVSKGRGTFKPVDKFKQQLRLSNSQLSDTLACPFGRTQYLEHLREIGLLED